MGERVLFDCFGDFEGFVLSDCHGAHTFRTRQREIGEIALRACKERLLLSVYVDGEHDRSSNLQVSDKVLTSKISEGHFDRLSFF